MNTVYYTIYRVTNLINGKIYIGVHAVENLECDDGYMGSGLSIKRAIRKYSRENFKKEILVYFDTPEEAYLAEVDLVDSEFVARRDTYNLRCGGIGNGPGEKNSMFGKTGEQNPFYGKHHSEETKRKLSLAKSGSNHSMYGKHHSDETKRKMSHATKGRRHSDEHRANHAKSWILSTKDNPIRALPWTIMFGDKVLEIKNLKKFCRERNIHYLRFYRNIEIDGYKLIGKAL